MTWAKWTRWQIHRVYYCSEFVLHRTNLQVKTLSITENQRAQTVGLDHWILPAQRSVSDITLHAAPRCQLLCVPVTVEGGCGAPVNGVVCVPDSVKSVINSPLLGSIFRSLAFWDHPGQAALLQSLKRYSTTPDSLAHLVHLTYASCTTLISGFL